MSSWDFLFLEEFLSLNPRMRLTRYCLDGVIVRGEYTLNAQAKESQPICQTFTLSIEIAPKYPQVLPAIFDRGGYFPRDKDHHVYEDGSFCLGSELRLRAILHRDPSFSALVANIIDPFLYSVSHYLLYGSYPFGQLAHGENGLVDDYESLFEVNGKPAVLRTLSALSKRKRVANKTPCPCGCFKRLGRCNYRFKLNEWRSLDTRSWFHQQLQKFTPLEKL